MSDGNLYLDSIARLLSMFPEPKAFPIRPSASVVPWRQGRDGRTEVFWVRRSPALGVLGGWYAFPGGGVSRADAALPIARGPRIPDDCRTNFPAYDLTEWEEDLPPGIVACALREVFEEVRLPLFSSPPAVDATQLEQDRLRLVKDAKIFAGLLRDWQTALDGSRLVYAGRWITPPVAPMRFDTRFFLLEWPHEEAQQPAVDGEELVEGEWIAAEDAIKRWESGEILAAPPTLYILDILGRLGPDQGLARLVEHGREFDHPIKRFLEARPGIIGLPLITPTLPPARETMSYLVGKSDVLLVDVGSPFAGEVDRLATLIQFLDKEFGKRLKAVVLTHHHPDHVWGVNRLREQVDVPVWAHAECAERVQSMGIHVDRFLVDGERISLGTRESAYEVEIVETPGHARGHLSIFEPTHRSVVAGDLVAGRGTIMIDPPDGDMDDYMRSLERVLEREPRTLFPSHGPVIQNASEHLRQLMEHRLIREESIREHWERGTCSIDELVRQVYTDVDIALHPFAERQALAHLDRLSRHGKINR